MSVKPAQRLLTVEEYYKMAEAGILTQDDHVELIEGKIIEMSPIGSKHAACVDKILAVFNRLGYPNILVRGQNPLRLGQHSEPEPDIAIVKYTSDFYASRHPLAEDTLLVIEVSDTTLDYDTAIKLPLYASAGIPEYWIINLVENNIAVNRQPQNNTYKFTKSYSAPEEIMAGFLDAPIKVAELLV